MKFFNWPNWGQNSFERSELVAVTSKVFLRDAFPIYFFSIVTPTFQFDKIFKNPQFLFLSPKQNNLRNNKTIKNRSSQKLLNGWAPLPGIKVSYISQRMVPLSTNNVKYQFKGTKLRYFISVTPPLLCTSNIDKVDYYDYKVNMWV